MVTDVDPIAVEVLRNRLISVAAEMGAVLRRSGHSPNIRDREDFSCVLADAEGAIVAQAEHIPGHLGMLSLAMAYICRRFPSDSWSEGDVLVFNEPYEGASHLPDIRIVVPIFVDGVLVGFSANLAHHADVGGMAPGSMPANSTEIIQEGIMIPFLKLYRRGTLNQELLEMFLANVRTPAEREGDLRAQVAAAQLGQRRIQEIVRRTGVDRWIELKNEILNQTERLMRASIRQRLPAGTFTAEQYVNDDGTDAGPIKIRVSISIAGDNILVDLTGTDPQRPSAVNCLWGQTVSAAYFVIKAAVAPDIPVNSGCYRPITVMAPLGIAVRPTPPTAIAAGNETVQRVDEALISALSLADPTIAKAPSHGCMNNVVLGGTDPRTGGVYTYYETIGGGEGARFNKDGMDGVHVLSTNTLNTPVEVVEMSTPLRIEEYSLISDSGGQGKFRGGLGIRRRYRVLESSATLVVNSDWIHSKPPGLAGGGSGAPTRLIFDEGTAQQREPHYSKLVTTLQPGEAFTLCSGGGAGFGRLEERDAAAIAADLRDAKVTSG